MKPVRRPRTSVLDTEPMKTAPAQPVPFGTGFAFHHPAEGDIGYVFCSSWGYDEMCSRKFLRLVAQELADSGAPALRFDYPGTINMLDIPQDMNLDGWVGAAFMAADTLKNLSGCTAIVFVGMGIGSAVAFQAAKNRQDVAGLILAAPVTSGRRYMRELKIQAKVSDESLGLALQGKHGDTGFTGYAMGDALQASLKSIKLSTDGFSTKPKCLIVHREENDTETDFADTLSGAGWQVERTPFTGYLQLLATPTTSVLPRDVMSRISAFAKSNFGSGEPSPENAGHHDDGQLPVLRGDTFTEEPVLFGPDKGLFGILCEPLGPRRGPVFVFLNTGYCHHIGWGRIYVRAARYLAQQGIATFRFDMAGVGESPAVEGRAEQVLYTDDQFQDAGHALEYLKQRLPGPLYLVGRCSGAYVAFHTAAQNPNVDGVMMINQLKLIWDPGEDVYEAINFGARPLEEYRRRALSLKTFKRILRGDVDLKRAGSHILRHVRDRIVRNTAPYLGSLTKLGRFRRACFDRFEALAVRNIPVTLLNCEHDGSLDELAKYFGPDFSGLAAYSNVRRMIVPNADHNLTPEDAQLFLLDQMSAVAEDPRWQNGSAENRVA